MARPKKPVQLLTGNNFSDSEITNLKEIEKRINNNINQTLDFKLEFISAAAKKEFNNIFNALSELNILNNADKPMLAEWCNLNQHVKELNKAIKLERKKEDIKFKLEIVKVQNAIGNNLGFGVSNKRAILELIKEQNEENKNSNMTIEQKLKLLEDMND